MRHVYPEPEDVGISIPRHLREDRFRTGFRHALEGGQITHREQLRRSFRFGFRAGKLLCRELRRRQGVLTFPLQGRVATRVRH